MAGPSQVEFPGKKKQRLQMKGTKKTNDATSKKIQRSLTHLYEDPWSHLPDITYSPVSKFGRKDAVQATIKEIEKIIHKKFDKKWLAKKMMAKRADPVAKAFAGSLHASFDTDFSTVGKFSSPSFGTAAYVRRGDGKPGYMAGIQNFSHITLRMLPWEEHAKRGYYFFSWDGGFVSTGLHPNPPQEWLADVLNRSRFDFVCDQSSDQEVWLTDGLEARAIIESQSNQLGYIRLKFHHGPIVAIGFDQLEKAGKKDSAFIHHLALSMLPPLLPSILDITAIWMPNGWPANTAIPKAALDAIDEVLDAWQGLTMNEGILSQVIMERVIAAVDSGIVVHHDWFADDESTIRNDVAQRLQGSDEERNLCACILIEKMELIRTVNEGVTIDSKGRTTERDSPSLYLREHVSCGDLLSAFWEDCGKAALVRFGLTEQESELLWIEQLEKPKPFGKFLKSMDEARSSARQRAKFPSQEQLSPTVEHLQFLVIQSLLNGLGSAEQHATKRAPSVELAAASWSWLVAVGRARGQEWHFDDLARERGNVWSPMVKQLFECGQLILESNDEILVHQQSTWESIIEELSTLTQ